MIAITNPIPDDRMALHELSALVGRHNAMQTDQNLMLPDVAPPVVEDLDTVLVNMASQGYKVGAPLQHSPSRRANHTEWRVRVSCNSWDGMLAFCVAVRKC